MRYTTIIDITDNPIIYRNLNARLVYLHLCLKAGYHDSDKDLVSVSIRRLAASVGLSVSAVRHSLKLLQKHGLLVKNGSRTIVTKWVMTEEITARPKTKKMARDAELAAERRRQEIRLEHQYRRKTDEEFKADVITQYERFLQQQADGSISSIGRRYLELNRANYERAKRSNHER